MKFTGLPIRGSKAASLASACSLSRLVHPLEPAQPLFEGGAEIDDQLVHLPPALGREVAFDIDLAHRLADRAVQQRNAALPAVALALAVRAGSGRRTAKLASSKARGRNCALAVDEVEGHPVLPGLQRHAVEHLPDRGDRCGLGGDDRRHSAEAAAAARPRRPLELRRERVELRAVHRIVDLLDVAAALGRPMRLGDAPFERDDRVGLRLGHPRCRRAACIVTT